MNAAARLAAFTAGLVVVFAAGYVTAAALVPDTEATAQQQGVGAHTSTDHGATAEQEPAPTFSPAAAAGLALAQDGYVLTPVRAPGAPNDPGILDFSILDSAGKPLLDYTTVHEKQLHLIVIRSDGAYFDHVHPALDKATGTWSIPWTWNAAGTYRVYADFQPAANNEKLTLSRTVEVAGVFTPDRPVATRTVDQVAGYTVHLDGALAAGASAQLTARITRAGRPVTTMQPYLGAFGHLVALRDGDLAYLHVHPEGAEPVPGLMGGPVVSFAATAPTVGRYLLYFDFQVDGTVHTTTFVIDAADGDGNGAPEDTSHGGGHAGGH